MSENKPYESPAITRVQLEDKRVVVMVTCRKEDAFQDPNCYVGDQRARDEFDPS
jgi:hypothetical protein